MIMRSTVVIRGDDQCGPVDPSTVVYVKKHAGTHNRNEVGYWDMEGKDMDEYVVLGVTQIMVPADQDELTVVQSGEISVAVDPYDKLEKHDRVKIERRNGRGVIVKAADIGPEFLVAPGSNANQGLGMLAGAIAEAAIAGLNPNAGQIRQAKADAALFVRNAMKAKKPVGARAALAKGVREAQDGSRLLIQAIKMANTGVFGKITKMGKKKRSAHVRTFKN